MAGVWPSGLPPEPRSLGWVGISCCCSQCPAGGSGEPGCGVFRTSQDDVLAGETLGRSRQHMFAQRWRRSFTYIVRYFSCHALFRLSGVQKTYLTQAPTPPCAAPTSSNLPLLSSPHCRREPEAETQGHARLHPCGLGAPSLSHAVQQGRVGAVRVAWGASEGVMGSLGVRAEFCPPTSPAFPLGVQ